MQSFKMCLFLCGTSFIHQGRKKLGHFLQCARQNVLNKSTIYKFKLLFSPGGKPLSLVHQSVFLSVSAPS